MDKHYTISIHGCNSFRNASVLVYEDGKVVVECVGADAWDIKDILIALGDKYNTSDYLFF
nr:MAG TPA: hypothetical protein [Caudoviricetes sp.]